jgi:hypothetical protein
MLRDRRGSRTALAVRTATVYAAILAGALVMATATARKPFWEPLAVAGPLIAVQLAFDARSRSRRLAPELLGPIAIGAVAPAIALAGGETASLAAGLWLVVALRAVGSVVLVRAQLRRAKGQPYSATRVHLTNGATALVALAGAFGPVPWLGAAAIGLLPAVALWELLRPPVRATVVGIHQTVLGIAVVALTAVGARAGW